MALHARPAGLPRPRSTDGAPAARALGMSVDASFACSGLRGASGPDDGRRVRLDVASEVEIEAAWPGAELDPAQSTVAPWSGIPVRTEHHHEAGYLVSAPGRGRHLVDLDGRWVRCATTDSPRHCWQGFLAGQVLPLAAGLQGLEILQASAVVVAGQVMAFAGPAGVGKSALAAHLMLVGARFFADDVVGLEARAEQVVAHTGLGVVRLGDRGRSAIPHLKAQGAAVIGRDGKTLVELERDVAALPLHSLYLLEIARGTGGVEISAEPADPIGLLAALTGFGPRTPERLRRQLELVALLSARVRISRARAPRGAEDELARAIYSHAALAVLL